MRKAHSVYGEKLQAVAQLVLLAGQADGPAAGAPAVMYPFAAQPSTKPFAVPQAGRFGAAATAVMCRRRGEPTGRRACLHQAPLLVSLV